jgi:hypothetical protein
MMRCDDDVDDRAGQVTKQICTKVIGREGDVG